jgi:hypothetical protein
MKIATKLLLIVVGLLLLADICLRIHYRSIFSSTTASVTNSITGKPLFVTIDHSSSASWAADRILMRRDNVWEPLWVEWDFNHDGKPDEMAYFFQGKDAFDITFSTNHPPKFSVYFRGTAKSVTWWLDRGGNGSFTERIFYDTNGDFSKHEVWYNEGWQTVDRRNETNGIVINGQWLRLGLDTNGAWNMKAATNR